MSGILFAVIPDPQTSVGELADYDIIGAVSGKVAGSDEFPFVSEIADCFLLFQEQKQSFLCFFQSGAGTPYHAEKQGVKKSFSGLTEEKKRCILCR